MTIELSDLRVGERGIGKGLMKIGKPTLFSWF